METATRPDPSAVPHPALVERGFFRLSVADYHDLGERGILTPDDRVELIDGYLVIKPMHNSRGASTVVRVARYLDRATPPGFVVRSQVPITLEFGEPEPDAVVARGDLRTYDRHHPKASDLSLAVEILDSSLRADREYKSGMYARAGIPLYWIVNLIGAIVEVYTVPTGPCDEPMYNSRRDYTAADSLPLVLDGQHVASIPVAELLP